jgi:hypothetical protein
MMRVHIKMHYTLADMLGEGLRYVDFERDFPDGATVKTVLETLAVQYGAAFYKFYNPNDGVHNYTISVIVDGTLRNPVETMHMGIKDHGDVYICPVYLGG